MMGNFFNRMYYGKSGKEDYTRDDLPDNRWQLFLAMIRLNIGKIITVNLLFVLFFLPIFIWVFIMNVPLMAQYLQAGEMTAFSNTLVFTVYLCAPLLIVLSPGIVGLTYVTRNMARDENVWVWADFWTAVKTNWKQMLAMGGLNALALILVYVGSVFYSAMSAQSPIFMAARILILVGAVIWFSVNLYIWPMIVTYELKLKNMLKNAAILCIARLPQTLFMLLISLLLPAMLLLIPNAIVALIITLVYLVLGFSLWSMAINSITTAVFDRFINVRIKGAKVNRGLSTAYDEYAAENADLDEAENKDE